MSRREGTVGSTSMLLNLYMKYMKFFTLKLTVRTKENTEALFQNFSHPDIPGWKFLMGSEFVDLRKSDIMTIFQNVII